MVELLNSDCSIILLLLEFWGILELHESNPTNNKKQIVFVMFKIDYNDSNNL
ncbi:hypothetical protein GCM10009118_03510 [Wandonia haliotis]|uniref:Uncharacterized protein n=1 Tax=Wandonia haliotis TaxID=574963 RepID=A0ABN1ML90_9FLAO